MIRDLYLEPGQLAAAQVSTPTASDPGRPTIEFKVRLNRTQSTGASVSVPAAADLAGALALALREADPGQGAPLEEFARWIVSLDDPDGPGFEARKAVTMAQIIGKARDALGLPEEW